MAAGDRQGRRSGRHRVIAPDLPGHGDSGYWKRLARMRRPALMLWGERDPLVPLAHARAVSRALPHATSLILKGCGHVPQYELPELTNRLLTRFLNSTSR